ncbi:Diaminopimelate epimerase-like protein [Linderina pennispora]|uniref:Diaminopimelate epimerase-like protein n=1 Tax=Linderina pennispora TaxID=61395 RepID=A0A1Y1VY18_9FUNG|nr:Diaminopimelate epimerase-like protein [Linderina pennispora]ORX65925.1 Diaminopimelate epimerase-like protein [Linderina pennispora]
MASYQIFIVDAFTDRPFSGNPAAVVPVPASQPIVGTRMLQIAAEMNLSETAFVIPKNANGPNAFQEASHFDLRKSTYAVMPPLATAYVLFFKLQNISNELRFDTLGGELVVRRGTDGHLDMTFPVDMPKPVDVNDDVKLLISSVYGEYRDSIEVELSPALRFLIVHDPDTTKDHIVGLEPRFSPAAIAAGERLNLVAVLITARGVEKDFHSRVFGPWVGVGEDPVCGSAHTVLAPFWHRRLGKTFVLCHPGIKATW